MSNMKCEDIFFAAIFVLAGFVSASDTIRLIEPADGGISYISRPHFSWEGKVEDSPGQFGCYRVEIASDHGHENIIDCDKVASVIRRYVPFKPLDPGRYWWRVKRFDVQGVTLAESRICSFTVKESTNIFTVKVDSGFEEIQEVVRNASGNTPSKIVFEKGVYNLSDSGNAVFLELSGVTNLVVEGSGAMIIMHASGRYLDISGCAGIEVRNFEFDMNPLPYSAGIVREIDAATGTFVVDIAGGHPLPDSCEDFMRDRKGMIYDSRELRMKRDVPLVFSHAGWKRLDESRYRFDAESPKSLRQLAAGDIYILDPRRGIGFSVRYSEQVVLSDLGVYAVGNIGFSSHYANRLSILNCRLERREGRYLTCNNGGHNHHNARIGPWIEGCLFENTGDDICHVNSLSLNIASQPAPDAVRLFLSSPHDYGRPVNLDFRKGDDLWFYDRGRGRVLARRCIRAVGVSDNKFLDVTLDAPVEGVVCGRHVAERDRKRGRSGSAETTQLFNMSRSCSQFVFRNNRVIAGRRIGVLAKGSGGLVENNYFEGLGGGAVELWNAPYEGLGALDYVVRGNVIKECCRIDRFDAPIWIQAFKSGNHRIHGRVLIENNAIDGYDGCAILIKDTAHALVRKNAFKNGAPDQGGPVVHENVDGQFQEKRRDDRGTRNADTGRPGGRISGTEPGIERPQLLRRAERRALRISDNGQFRSQDLLAGCHCNMAYLLLMLRLKIYHLVVLEGIDF